MELIEENYKSKAIKSKTKRLKQLPPAGAYQCLYILMSLMQKHITPFSKIYCSTEVLGNYASQLITSSSLNKEINSILLASHIS